MGKQGTVNGSDGVLMLFKATNNRESKWIFMDIHGYLYGYLWIVTESYELILIVVK